MSTTTVGLLFMALLLALILLRFPIAIAMMIAAVGGIATIQGWHAALFQLGSAPIAATEYGLSVIPLFVLLGAFAERSGMARELFTAADAMVGHRRGGLAMASLIGCAGFSSISGSSLATAATMGGISLDEMKRRNYAPSLAAGTVAAGGTIGILIPPSVILILYAILTEQSVRTLFMAALFPGLLLTALLLATVAVWVRIDPGAAGRSPRRSMADRIAALGGVWPMVILFAAVIGGLSAGLFSPTEAAGIGAFGAWIIGLARRRLNGAATVDALVDTAVTTAMIFLIVIGSTLFSSFLAVTGITGALLAAAGDGAWSPMAVLLLILLTYIVLGCFMDSLGMVILTVPVFYPLITQLGFDPVWFGVMMVIVVEMGLISPPVGLNVFVVRGVAPDIPLERIFKGVLPFFGAFLIALALLTAFPSIALWLPEYLS